MQPALYALWERNPQIVFDVTKGNNAHTNAHNVTCAGFDATTGFDPITGLGTPVFSELARELLK